MAAPLTPDDWDRLCAEAIAAREAAYAPYSNFRVGAALLAASGKIIRGCNVENATYGATCCAERTAVFSAVAAGEMQFAAMAVATDLDEPATSCGICRQVLAEFGPALELVFVNLTGTRRFHALRALLPHSFALDR